MKEPDELLKKIYGYISLPKGILLLLRNKTLSKEEFILYLSSLILAVWDKNKEKSYGSMDLNKKEIEEILNFSKGFVSKFDKGLFKKGFWRMKPNKRIEIAGYNLTDTVFLKQIASKEKLIDPHKQIAFEQTEIANQQKEVAHKQQNLSIAKESNQDQKVADQQLSPSISDIRSYKDRYNLPRSEKEYEEIKKELNLSLLTTDDMKWIDLNVYEDPNVPS